MASIRVLSSAAALACVLAACGATTGPPGPIPQPATPAVLLSSTDPDAPRLRAVGRLSGSSSCTAAVITGAGPVEPSARVLLLTNGHCVDRYEADAVAVDEPAPPGLVFTPAYFRDSVARHRRIDAALLRYATMAGLDIAVVELDATYAELAELGVEPLVVTTDPGGAAIEYAGVPVDDVPVPERYLRRGTCAHQPPVTVAEHRWIWYGLLPNNCQGISGGASGSPVLRAGTREVIGTINTRAEPSPAPLCALNHPCEVTAMGVQTRGGTAYTVATAGLAGCLTPGPRFDLAAPGCDLAPGGQVDLGTDGIDVRLQARTLPFARVKTGLLGSTDCRAPDGYGPALAVAEHPAFTDPDPEATEPAVLCVLAGPDDTPDAGWPPGSHATHHLWLH